jgi:acid phosphatase class B
MRKFIATLSVVCLLAAIGAYVAFAATPNVSWHLGTNKTVKIHRGQKVTWTWTGDAPHNVKGKGFMSATKNKKGFTYSHVFKTKGSFTITCTIHPGAMKTVVKVS